MSARHKSVVKDPTGQGGTAVNFFQQNQFIPKELLPDPVKLERLRANAPEVYQAFVRQFEQDAIHNREMQAKAIAIDEKAIPAITLNDRIGIVAAWSVTAAAIGGGLYCAITGIDWGWTIALFGTLPQVVTAFRVRMTH